MKAISKDKIALVVLVQAKVSEDELAAYEAALSYALDTLMSQRLSGASALQLMK